MIAATAASTSVALSRLFASGRRKAVSNPASRVASLTGIGPPQGCRRSATSSFLTLPAHSIAKALDPTADLFRASLQRRPIDDQPGADLGNALHLDQTVRLQRSPGLDEIDDVMAETETGGELDRTVQLDTFRLDAACSKMVAGDLRVLGGDPDVARASDMLPRDPVWRRRERGPAKPDGEVERRVNLRVVEFHQHVVAGDPELSRAEGDESGDVKAAHPDQIQLRRIGREAKLARAGIFKGRLRYYTNTPEQRHHLAEDPTVRQRQNQWSLGVAWIGRGAHTRSSTSCRGCHGVGQGSPRSCAWQRMRLTTSRIVAPSENSSRTASCSPSRPGRIASSDKIRAPSLRRKP